MTDFYLAVIALSVFVMAAIQVGAIVLALRAAKRVDGAVSRMQQDIKPIVANLQTMSADASRATAKIAAQVDRLEAVLNDVSKRIEDTATAVQETVAGPIREAMSIIHGLKAAFVALRALSGEDRPRRRRGDPATEDDDPLFVG